MIPYLHGIYRYDAKILIFIGINPSSVQTQHHLTYVRYIWTQKQTDGKWLHHLSKILNKMRTQNHFLNISKNLNVLIPLLRQTAVTDPICFKQE